MIYVGSDHRGFYLKELIVAMLGEDCHDLGATDNCGSDYPIIAQAVATSTVTNPTNRGILICGSGIGVAIAANKVAGARAATCRTVDDAAGTRKHNDANILCIGTDITDCNHAFEIIGVFMATEFEGGRHQRRVDLIE